MKSRFKVKICKPEEIDLCYGTADESPRAGNIGFLRGDFGRSGKEFWSRWFGAHNELNTPEFMQEFDDLINELRDTEFLKDKAAMQSYCWQSGCEKNNDSYHFTVETKDYLVCFRCMLNPGSYNYYAFAYKKDQMQCVQDNNMEQEEPNDGFKLDL